MSITHRSGVYLADTARVIGQVSLGTDANIWYGASIRGDVAPITIGRATNIQDNAVVHCDTGVPNDIGSDVTVGHSAVVHGTKIGDGTLIGIGAIVLGQSTIGNRCLIAAGALVPPGMNVPDDSVVMGVPGQVVRRTNEKEQQYLAWLPQHYVELAQLHYQSPDSPRIKSLHDQSPGVA